VGILAAMVNLVLMVIFYNRAIARVTALAAVPAQ
jgi:hypothetical protein